MKGLGKSTHPLPDGPLGVLDPLDLTGGPYDTGPDGEAIVDLDPPPPNASAMPELTFPAPILPFPNAAVNVIASFLHPTGRAPPNRFDGSANSRPPLTRPPGMPPMMVPPPPLQVAGVARALEDMGTCRVSLKGDDQRGSF